MCGEDLGSSGFVRERGAALGLAAVLAVELLVFVGLHRQAADLQRAYERGTPSERIAALHVLLHRDRPLVLYEYSVAGLLASSDAEVAEFLMVEGVVEESQAGARRRLESYAYGGALDERLKARCQFLLCKEQGLQPIREYLQACRGDSAKR